MHEPFRVVQSIDAEDNFLARVGANEARRLFSHPLEPIKRNTNGQGGNFHQSGAVLDQQVFAVHPAAQSTVAAVQKVDTVVLNMETYYVAAWIQ